MAWKPISTAPKDGTTVRGRFVIVIGGDQTIVQSDTFWNGSAWEKPSGGTWAPSQWRGLS